MTHLCKLVLALLVSTVAYVGTGAQPAFASDAWCAANSTTPVKWDTRLYMLGGDTTTTCKGIVHLIKVRSELHRYNSTSGQWVASGAGESACEDTDICTADAWFNCKGMGNPSPAFLTRGESISLFGFNSSARNSSISGWKQFDCGSLTEVPRIW